MARIIGIDKVSEEATKKRVEELQKKYPDSEFEYRQHDTRFEFVVKEVTPNMGQALLDQMRRTAEGLDPVVQDVDVNDPKTTQGVTTGATGSAAPAGGTPTAGAGPV